MSLTWAIVWALGDVASYALQSTGMGVDYGAFDVQIMLESAISGALAGGIAGILLQIPYFGISTNSIALFFLTLICWVGADIVSFAYWDEIGLFSLEDYLGYTGVVGVVFGLIACILLQTRKPGWFVIKIPIGAVFIAIAAVIGRYVQIMMIDL